MKVFALALAAAALVSAPTIAQAATYVTDTYVSGDLGGHVPGDRITLNSVTGAVSGEGTYLVNTVDFAVSEFSFTNPDYSGTFTNNVIVDGNPLTYDVPYQLTLGVTDSIVLGGNEFNVQGYHIKLNPLAFTDVPAFTTVYGDLTATITAISAAPEPGAWALMFGGVGLAGLALRRRKEQAGATFAA